MWGSSDKNIWVVGHGDVSYNCIWHYDGVKWQRDSVRLSSNHQSVYGFGPNDVWIVDAPNGERIWHYNGSQWSLFGNYKKPTQSIFYLGNVWGDAANNVYAVGSEISTSDNMNHAVIMNYDKTNWKYLVISDVDVALLSIRRENQSTKYYLVGAYFGATESLYEVYEFDEQQQLKEIYSNPSQIRNVNLINGKIYFSGGKQIWKYRNNQFEVWKDFSSTDFHIGTLWGKSESDIFAQGFEGNTYGIVHFNGSDWKMLYPLNGPKQYFLSSMAVFDSTVFALVGDNTTNMIVRGKLQNH